MTTIGIDFGTSKTMAAWVNPKTGHHEVINLGDEHNYIPTTVFIGGDGNMFFGDEADDLAVEAPDRYARGFKAKLGSDAPALLCFSGGKPSTYTARQLTAAYLRHVRQLCEARACFGTVDAAVITRPVDFSPAQVEELRMAAEEAGFREISLVTEPEAAGYAFCLLSPENAFQGSALIVDWGGGTLDMSIVERSGDKVKTDRTRVSGENTLGGEQFDTYLWQHVTTILSGKGTDINAQPKDVIHQAQVQVRKAKEALSKRESKELRLSTPSGATPPVTVRREDFEALIGKDIQRAAGMARQLVQQTRQGGGNPEMLLLVGGTSLIPLVRSQMESQTGLPTHQWQYTREAVAIGAAMWLGGRNGSGAPSPGPAATGEGQAGSLYGQYRKHGDECLTTTCPVDLVTAAQWYAGGHEAGDLNCTYELIACYLEGKGVPRSYRYAAQLAQYLLEMNCPLGYVPLGLMYRDGHGVALDVKQGANYLEAALRDCAQPLPGIDDDVRYLALADAARGLDRLDEAQYWLRLYVQDERAVYPWGLAANSVMESSSEPTPEEEEYVRDAVMQGIRENDPFAMFIKAALTGGEGNMFPGSNDDRVQLLREAARRFPIPAVFQALAVYSGDEQVEERMWATAHLGMSCLRAEDELNCQLSVHANTCSAYYKVYESSVIQALMQSNRVKDFVTSPLSPRIVIANMNGFPIWAFNLRVCIRKLEYDNTFHIDATIQPGEQLDILLEDYGIPLADQMMLEIESNGKRSSIDYADVPLMSVRDYIDEDGTQPPLFMAWVYDSCGGYVVNVVNMGEETITNVCVRKRSGWNPNPINLAPGEAFSWGWHEFPDSRGLAENELFYLTCDGYLPVAAQILTT